MTNLQIGAAVVMLGWLVFTLTCMWLSSIRLKKDGRLATWLLS